MAFFNDLVRAIAEVEGMDLMTVRGIGIKVREAGLLSKGGRGLSAARMTARDAVALLTGVNGTSLSKDAGEAVRAYNRLVLTTDLAAPQDPAEWGDFRDKFNSIERVLMPGTTFQEAFEAFVAAFIPNEGADEYFDPEAIIEITFRRPARRAEINVYWEPHDGGDKYEFFTRAYFEDPDSGADSGDLPDRSDSTTISRRTLTAVGRILAS